MTTYAIHWFRRDLRVAGNLALMHSFKKHKGRVVGVFCFDKAFLSREDFSVNRFQVFLETINALKTELLEMGSDLIVLDIGPQAGFEMLFKKLSLLKKLPSEVTFSRDYEPFARKRDEAMGEFFMKNSVEVKSFRDHLIIEPHELFKDDGDPYKVYTPFSRKWLSLFKEEAHSRVDIQESGLTYLEKRDQGKKNKPIFNLTWNDLFKSDKTGPIEDYLQRYIESNAEKVTIELPKAGSLEAYRKLKEFKNKISEYANKRDIPILEATSSLSVFLKNGSLTTAQIIKFFELENYDTKNKNSRDTYFSELIWREFYYHVLYHFPYSEKEAFNPKYKNINWDNNKAHFEAWKHGRTGFPIVDAGMRQLNKTGLMHNRVRMIVASFLVKDLLIDWRWGEQYFMDQLLDGDLAPNNGGWQWAASTGCDAQPYFRIFNPWSQSKKFDGKAEYMKKYIPELKDLESKAFHKPILDHPSYPAPIVDHAQRRLKTLEIYKKL